MAQNIFYVIFLKNILNIIPVRTSKLILLGFWKSKELSAGPSAVFYITRVNLCFPFLCSSCPEWPSCHRPTSWRSSSIKSKSSTRDSPSNILKFPHFSRSIHKRRSWPNTTKSISRPEFYLLILSAFSAVALVVSVMTHSNLYSCHIWTFAEFCLKALFVPKKKKKKKRYEIKLNQRPVSFSFFWCNMA